MYINLPKQRLKSHKTDIFAYGQKLEKGVERRQRTQIIWKKRRGQKTKHLKGKEITEDKDAQGQGQETGKCFPEKETDIGQRMAYETSEGQETENVLSRDRNGWKPGNGLFREGNAGDRECLHSEMDTDIGQIMNLLSRDGNGQETENGFFR
jgi:hypothetical protein